METIIFFLLGALAGWFAHAGVIIWREITSSHIDTVPLSRNGKQAPPIKVERESKE